MNAEIKVIYAYHYFCHPKTDYRCPALPYVSNTQLGPYTTDVGHAVQLSCSEGYQFPDRSTFLDIVCLSDLTWEMKFPYGCKGNDLQFLMQMSKILCLFLAVVITSYHITRTSFGKSEA